MQTPDFFQQLHEHYADYILHTQLIGLNTNVEDTAELAITALNELADDLNTYNTVIAEHPGHSDGDNGTCGCVTNRTYGILATAFRAALLTLASAQRAPHGITLGLRESHLGD